MVARRQVIEITPTTGVVGDPGCEACGLHAFAHSVCLMGEGPVPCDIMVIGEAPGFSDDRNGEPMGGKPGKILDEYLEAAQIPRDQVYVTNTVKCRPPDKRKPSNGEIKACKPWLELEIEKVQPKYVMLLGAYAVKSVLKKGKITQMRGQCIEMDGIKYMPVFHPNAGLHNPGQLPAIKEDIKRFAEMVRGETREEEEIKWHVLKRSNYSNFKEEFAAAEEIAFDLETTRLEPHWPDSEVSSISLAFETGSTWVIPLNIEGSFLYGDHDLQTSLLQAITSEATTQKKNVTGHNGKFDNLWLLVKYGCQFFLNDDSQLMHYILDENSPHDLKFLARVVLNATDYNLSTEDKQGKFDKTEANLRMLYKYNAKDSYYTLQLKQRFREQLLQEPELRRLYYKVVMPASRMFTEIETEGQFIDMEYRARMSKELAEEEAEALRNLNAAAGKEINWNSPKQVGQLLYGDLGLEILAKTDAGAPSTAEPVLLQLRGKHPIVDHMLSYRGVNTLKNNFIDGWEKLMQGEYLYISTNLHGTVTGRYASRLHQTPRDARLRSQITAPPGWVFFCADYSQIELRIAAMLSGDERMKTVFATGGDIHKATASAVTGIPEDELTKEERKKAKAVNFGFVYGMGHKKFIDYARDKYEVILTPIQSKRFRTRFFETYSGLEPWHDRYRRIVQRQGYVTSFSGRKRRLPGIYSEDDGVRSEAERQAINTPVQGFGSGDLKVMAMLEIHEYFDRDILRLKGEVHDSVLGWVREDMVHKVLPIVRRIMVHPKLLDQFHINLNVPIVVDIEVGPWGSGKPLEEYV